MIWALTKELFASRIGQGLIAALVLLALAWWAYSSVWQRGYDVAAAEGDARLRSMQAQIEAERQASERQARATEQQHRDALAAVATQYEQDKANAQTQHDNVVAGLRAGSLRLRDQWNACRASRVPEAAAGAGQLDGAPDDRSESVGRILLAAAQCDAQVAGLQSAVRALTGQP